VIIFVLGRGDFDGEFLKRVFDSFRKKESGKEIVLKRLHNLARKELFKRR